MLYFLYTDSVKRKFSNRSTNNFWCSFEGVDSKNNCLPNSLFYDDTLVKIKLIQLETQDRSTNSSEPSNRLIFIVSVQHFPPL